MLEEFGKTPHLELLTTFVLATACVFLSCLTGVDFSGVATTKRKYPKQFDPMRKHLNVKISPWLVSEIFIIIYNCQEHCDGMTQYISTLWKSTLILYDSHHSKTR